jgi:YegS/Rv2252/BmrU family lipid kinase
LRVKAIVNPRAGNGRAGKQWPQVEQRLREHYPDLHVHLTSRPFEATEIARHSLSLGYELLVSVGGDGTLNEVVNGFFDGDRPLAANARLSVIPAGTGSDFVRSIGLPGDPLLAAERIHHGSPRLVDVGRLRCTGHDRQPKTQYFINVSGLGFGGAVAVRVNGAPKIFGGFLTYLGGLLITLASYENVPVHVRLDEMLDEEMTVNSIHVANGQFFGGGMWIAPEAKPDDGLLDVVIVGDLSRREAVMSLPALYRGTLGQNPKVKLLSGRRLEVFSAQEVLLETDGEAPGKLPAVFEILPKAIGILT